MDRDGIRTEDAAPGIRRILLAKPETRNAQDTRMLYALDDASREAMDG